MRCTSVFAAKTTNELPVWWIAVVVDQTQTLNFGCFRRGSICNLAKLFDFPKDYKRKQSELAGPVPDY